MMLWCATDSKKSSSQRSGPSSINIIAPPSSLLQRSNSSVNKSLRDLRRSSLRRQSSQSFRMLKRQSSSFFESINQNLPNTSHLFKGGGLQNHQITKMAPNRRGCFASNRPLKRRLNAMHGRRHGDGSHHEFTSSSPSSPSTKSNQTLKQSHYH